MSPAPKDKKENSGTAAATATAPAPEKADQARKRRKPSPIGRLYWSISEVEEMTKVKSHVLRYWETEFPSLKPKKNSAGNRQYRKKDIDLALIIKHLLYEELYTIRGARKQLAANRKLDDLKDQYEIPFGTADQRQALREIRDEMLALRDLLAKM
jgi:DNA-binding transcriptional MerR regulator